MKRIGGRSIILKRIYHRRIVQRCLPGDARPVASAATRGPIGGDYGWIEAFMGEAPGYACRIEQIADIPARHVDQSAACGRADIVDGHSIPDQRISTVS